MDTIDAIKARRSVRSFDPEYKLSAGEEEQLMDLARMAPTAFNLQNWRMLIVKDSELRKQIREVSWGQAQVTDASLLVVLCADLNAWAKSPERYWEDAPQEVQDFMVPAIGEYYKGKDLVQRDEAMRSCGIAAQTLMLSAKAMGYDSCPMDGFDYEAVGKLINLPEDHIISMFVTIGKAMQPARPKGGVLPKNEVIIEDRFA